MDVEVKVKELNPAGYDLEILFNGVTIPAFMPNTLAGVNKLYDPTSIVGKTLNVMVEKGWVFVQAYTAPVNNGNNMFYYWILKREIKK